MNVLVVIFDRGSQSRSHFAFSVTARTAFQLAGFVTTLRSLLATLVRITMMTKSAPRALVGMGNHVMMKVVKVQ